MVDRVSTLVVFWRDEGLREDGGRTKFRREITSRFWNSPADTVVKRFGFFLVYRVQIRLMCLKKSYEKSYKNVIQMVGRVVETRVC